MYEQYFGLNTLPFKTTPDLKMFYKHGSRQEILDALLYTVKRGDGIVKVTGEVGSGKTLILRLLASNLPKDYEVIYINSPNLSPVDILLYICNELGITLAKNIHKFDITNALQQRLLEVHAENRKVVMLIDEAQSMTFDALEEIRLLSNIETDTDKLLQIVLFGQPELDVAINNSRVRQLKSRISYNIFVPPLDYREVQSYLNYRMRKAGYTGLDLFDKRISKRLHKTSKGLPRTINVIADKTLMAAFGSGSTSIKPRHVAIADDNQFVDTSQKKIIVYMLLPILLIITAIFYFSSGNLNLLTKIGEPSFSEVERTDDNVTEFNNSRSVLDNKADAYASSSLAYKSVDNDQKTLSAVDIPKKKANNEFKSNLTIQDPQVIVNDEALLFQMLDLHRSASQSLHDETEEYIIQLSTRNIKSLKETLKFYKKNLPDIDQLKIVIDYNGVIDAYRLKVFYKVSSSVSTLNKEIESLPKKFKVAQPYVTTVKQIRNNLRYTDQKLKEVGILYE